MKIAYIVSHPTQFEVPFFRRFEKMKPEILHVYYYNVGNAEGNLDEELGIKVKWGIDLYKDYQYFRLSGKKRLAEVQSQFMDESYDLVVISGYNSQFLIRLIFLCKRMGIPAALKLDTVLFASETWPKRMYRSMLIYLCQKYFCHFFVTGSLCEQYLQSYGVKEQYISCVSYVIDNHFFKTGSNLSDIERMTFRHELGVKGDQKVILCLSKLVGRESPWDVLEALHNIERKDLHLIVAGDGPDRDQLKERASDLNIPVTFLGHWPYKELPKLYGIADLFIHPAANEPWGVSVQEALACGLPVIASDRVGSAYDLIRPGENGFVYKYKDFSALKGNIIAVFEEFEMGNVQEVNDNILEVWNYDVMMNNIIEVTSRYP